MSTDQEFQLILSKLRRLRACDWRKKLFGAKGHKYVINPPLSEKEVAEFENKYQIELPNDYREFITKVGNGGAGPAYGLVRLEEGIFSDLDYKKGYIDPSTPFNFTEQWNMKYDGDINDRKKYDQFEEEYFDDKWVRGLLRICNSGCRIYVNLVVNGPEYGNLWIDDRGSDGGIYPLGRTRRTKFLEWYCEWLDRSLRNVSVPKWMFWYKDDL